MFGMELKDLLIYGGAGIGGLIVLLILVKVLGGGKKKPHKDLERSQRENLDEYPAAPPSKGDRRLIFDGVEVRLRLIVVAPVGKKGPIDIDGVPELLDDLLRGLGAFCQSDKPRIRIWPPQLSVSGFAPTFFRLVESPDDAGRKSQWIRVAGPIKIGGTPYLLGLAFHADEATKLGAIDLEAMAWSKHLQIERVVH